MRKDDRAIDLQHPLLKRTYALIEEGTGGEPFGISSANEKALGDLIMKWASEPSLSEGLQAYFFAATTFFERSPSLSRAMVRALGRVAPLLTGLGPTPGDRTEALGAKSRQFARLLGT